jgi:hypothetical protein
MKIWTPDTDKNYEPNQARRYDFKTLMMKKKGRPRTKLPWVSQTSFDGVGPYFVGYYVYGCVTQDGLFENVDDRSQQQVLTSPAPCSKKGDSLTKHASTVLHHCMLLLQGSDWALKLHHCMLLLQGSDWALKLHHCMLLLQGSDWALKLPLKLHRCIETTWNGHGSFACSGLALSLHGVSQEERRLHFTGTVDVLRGFTVWALWIWSVS